MRVIAYAYNAGVHCPHCTKLAYETGKLKMDPEETNKFADSHGIPYTAKDSEGNLLGAMFSTDEDQEEYCGDCLKIIRY